MRPHESVTNRGNAGSSESQGSPVTDWQDLQSLAHEAVRTLSTLPWSGSQLDASDELIREVLCTVCRTAREQGMSIERVLLLLKRSWAQQPSLHGIWRIDTDRVLSNVITQCIKEYYGPYPRA